jgi:nitrate reductase delta subunit
MASLWVDSGFLSIHPEMAGRRKGAIMRLYQLFSDILDYPNLQLSTWVNECINILSSLGEGPVTPLKEFRVFLEKTPPSRVEEVYVKTFDLQADCYPYVGYHLFGDGSHRAMFLSGLKERYQKIDLPLTNELPDHLSVILRFLVKDQDAEEREELIYLCILPALKKMLKEFQEKRNPYKGVLEALLLVLQQGIETKDDMSSPTMKVEETYYG